MIRDSPPLQDTLYTIIVKGRVQGVGFRYFTRSLARQFGLTGWVRNLPSGDVSILVRMAGNVREEFVAAVTKGPPGGRVESIEVRRASGDAGCPDDGFFILS